MPASAEYIALPFDAAIADFRRKVNLPTRTWRDLWQGMHARGFVVAGAMKADLLADLRKAVDAGISQGTTIREFRKAFDGIVRRSGWKYRGGKAWRTAVIFNTNLSVAYHAGHYRQMTDPGVLKARPYWRYVASSSADPRPEHMRWYNTVLPADDPWWRTHYPPNGWGCKCGIVSHSAREVERIRKEAAEGPHPVKTTAPKDGTYEWVDKETGEVRRIPAGIDPGWDYNPGEAAWGRKISKDMMDAWRAQGARAWEVLTPGDWETAGRPETLAVDRPKAKAGPSLRTVPAIRRALVDVLGGEEKIFSFQSGGFRYDILVNAASLAGHIGSGRSAFLPFLPELLEDPYEVWLAFERHKGTGRTVLRQRTIKAVRLDKDRGLLLVAQSSKGVMEAWTMVPTSDFKYLNRQRRGKLIWARQ